MSVIEDEKTGVNAVSNSRDMLTPVARHAIWLSLLLLVCLLPYPLVAASPERISDCLKNSSRFCNSLNIRATSVGLTTAIGNTKSFLASTVPTLHP